MDVRACVLVSYITLKRCLVKRSLKLLALNRYVSEGSPEEVLSWRASTMTGVAADRDYHFAVLLIVGEKVLKGIWQAHILPAQSDATSFKESGLDLFRAITALDQSCILLRWLPFLLGCWWSEAHFPTVKCWPRHCSNHCQRWILWQLQLCLR